MRRCLVLVVLVAGCGEKSSATVDAMPTSDAGDAGPSIDANLALGCDCGSTDAAAPCLGTTVSHTRSAGSLPASTISFTFRCDGGPCACGRFANAYDYWVAPLTTGGTVEIVGMTPASVGGADATLRNGWVANPSATVASTFMDGRLGTMSGTGMPLEPAESDPARVETATVPVTTVVKSHSMLETGAGCAGTDTATMLSRHCFWQAGVLTVLDRVPADAGTTVLRPPLTGGEKPLISTTTLDLAALPDLPLPVRNDGTVVSGPAWDVALDVMAPPKVEWGASGNYTYWQYMPPMLNFSGHVSGYPPRSMERLLDAMQLLVVDGAGHEAEKRLLAIRAVQWGVDLYFMWRARSYGAMYQPNGGHAVGRYAAPVIAAALLTGTLGDQMKQDMLRVNNGTSDKCGFDIPGELWFWPDTSRVLYGYFNIPGCGGYSDYTQQTNSNYVDPAHVGDNGRLAVNADNGADDVNSCFGAYQPITAGPTQATANLLRAIPAARALAYAYLTTYAKRMVTNGAYCRADHTPTATYAQAFGTCVGGVNAGTPCAANAACPGSTCAGNAIQYASWFARNLWWTYDACYDTNSCPGM